MSETLTFIDPDGVETPLSSSTISTLWGVTGRFMPPIDYVEETTPERAGARIRATKIRPREIAVPLFLEGPTPAELRALIRDFARRLFPARGDGRLRNVGPDGDTRELLCRYANGLELTETTAEGGVTWQRTLIVFRAAEDPYWRAVDPVELDFGTGEPPAFFPIFPLRIARSSVFGGVTIDNVGDVEAWPIWTISGPGSNLNLENVTTGEFIALDTVLGAGDEIVIDTTPGVKSVELADGSNLFPDLVDGYSLFPLQKGENEISVGLEGADDTSAIALSYRPRFLTP